MNGHEVSRGTGAIHGAETTSRTLLCKTRASFYSISNMEVGARARFIGQLIHANEILANVNKSYMYIVEREWIKLSPQNEYESFYNHQSCGFQPNGKKRMKIMLANHYIYCIYYTNFLWGSGCTSIFKDITKLKYFFTKHFC